MVLLELSAAFDTVDHSILLEILRWDFGIEGCALRWFSSYLQLRSQFVLIDSHSSPSFSLKSGVPQGSCLGPLCFTAYASSLNKVINRHLPNGFGYADDTQLLHAFRPLDLTSETTALCAIQDCVLDIKKWITAHRLKLNDSKTELMIFGSDRFLQKLSVKSISVGNEEIYRASVVRNLGVLFDPKLSMEPHINSL